MNESLFFLQLEEAGRKSQAELKTADEEISDFEEDIFIQDLK